MAFSFKFGHFSSPLRFKFKHASADRSEAQNIIASVSNENGHVGFGEGCPRQYVTGETTKSVHKFLNEYGNQIAQTAISLDALRTWIKENSGVIDENPSAFCAIELAVLDLIGRQENKSFETLLGLPPLQKPIRYSAIMGDSRPSKTRIISLAYQLYGFSDFKLKLSGDLTRDQLRLTKLPKRATVRFDANNFWTDAQICIDYCRQLNHPFWAIEEPVDSFDHASLQAIAEGLDVKIILDESMYLKAHLKPYSKRPNQFIANIRVSKCGGILRSIELAKDCQARDHDIILGAHVGETSLLTRAALTVGQSMQTAPLAREGAYGSILLKQDISNVSLKFGLRGVMQPSKYQLSSNTGTGLAVVSTSVSWLN